MVCVQCRRILGCLDILGLHHVPVPLRESIDVHTSTIRNSDLENSEDSSWLHSMLALFSSRSV